MADSGKAFESDENASETKTNGEAPANQEIENNVPANQGENPENDDVVEENIQNLIAEKLMLDERGNQLQKLASELLKENRRLTSVKREQEKIFMEYEKNVTSIAKEIEGRLTTVYPACKENESVFLKFLECSNMSLGHTGIMSDNDKNELQRKTSEMQSLISKFQAQLSTVEKLMRPDYVIACQEDDSYFTLVMTECNKLEDLCYSLNALILQ